MGRVVGFVGTACPAEELQSYCVWSKRVANEKLASQQCVIILKIYWLLGIYSRLCLIVFWPCEAKSEFTHSINIRQFACRKLSPTILPVHECCKKMFFRLPTSCLHLQKLQQLL